MNLTNLKITDLFEGAKLAFLIGAGCSIDAPSRQPAGRAMMDSMIRFACAESEIERLISIEELRFEALVELLRDELDEDLKVIDYYNQCDKPNLQHFFLAEKIEQGHFIMTTNFDFLIEYALLQLCIPKVEILPVITKNDFQTYSNPYELFAQGKKALFKIHGSTQNIITGENTKDSLVATIQAFGSNKEGLDVFQIEPFKRPLLENISKRRSLVVIGYSGSDDFDIVPTLKVLSNLSSIIWINFVYDDEGSEKIYKVESSTIDSSKELSKVDQILMEIHEAGNVEEIYKVDVNTSRLFKKLIERKPELSLENFALDPMEWFQNNIPSPSKFKQYVIPYKIYKDFSRYDDAIRCATEILELAIKANDTYWKSIGFSYLGGIYQEQGNYDAALEYYNKSYEIDDQLKDLSGKAANLNAIALIYKMQGDYARAIEKYEIAVTLAEEHQNVEGKAIVLDNLAMLYQAEGRFDEALEHHEEALTYFEREGLLRERSRTLNNIGMLYKTQKRYIEALKRYQQSYQILDQLNDIKGKAIILDNIAGCYSNQGNFSEALVYYMKALPLLERTGSRQDNAIILSNMGDLYIKSSNYNEALKYFKDALKIYTEINDLRALAKIYSQIGMIYKQKGDNQEALEYFNKVLTYTRMTNDFVLDMMTQKLIRGIKPNHFDAQRALKAEKSHYSIDVAQDSESDEWNKRSFVGSEEEEEDLQSKAMRLFDMGIMYEEQYHYFEAIDKLREAQQINKSLNIPLLARQIPKRLIYLRNSLAKKSDQSLHEGDVNTAIRILNDLIKISEKWEDDPSKAAMQIKLARIFNTQKKYSEALELYKEAAKVFECDNKIQFLELAMKEMEQVQVNLEKHKNKLGDNFDLI